MIKKLQINYTTSEQSKRLLELGVPEDSADCLFYVKDKCAPIEIIPIGNREPPHTFSSFTEGYNDIFYPDNPSLFKWDNVDILPCWSVGRLIEIMGLCFDFELPSQGAIQIFKTDIEKGSVVDVLISDIEKFISKMNFSRLEE